jgi:hypothetical protein
VPPRLIEFDYLVTPDGLEYPFNTVMTRFLLTEISPLGLPGVDIETQRSPFQHGETALTYALQPRVLTMVHRREGCGRQAAWDIRQDMINHIRPNRQTTWGAYEPCQLIKVLPDNTRWALDVYWSGGLGFRARNEWDEWAAQDSIRFTAFDPTWYDPTGTTLTLAVAVAGSELSFPISFDGVAGIIFQAEDTIDDSATINYTGTWRSFPVIEIDGPITNPQIENSDTGELLRLLYEVSLGETVTIDCRTGQKTVENDSGTNLIGTLDDESDLGTFHLAPDPESPNGVNSIAVFGLNAASGITEFRFAYATRMVGL